MLDLLRGYQRQGNMPDFKVFCKEAQEKCGVTSGQAGPLSQRLKLLEAFVYESEKNSDLQEHYEPLNVESGKLSIVDLTNPLMSATDADGIFTVVLEKFRQQSAPKGVGKMVVLDEAHRYLQRGEGLAAEIVDCARVMRHNAMRVVVSTQSPLTLPPELFELCTAAILHRFHSRDWLSYLSSKIILPDNGMEIVQELVTGEGLVFCAGANNIKVRVRPRITGDLGASSQAE
jgi:DNA helicase HerA-like ATPase